MPLTVAWQAAEPMIAPATFQSYILETGRPTHMRFFDAITQYAQEGVPRAREGNKNQNIRLCRLTRLTWLPSLIELAEQKDPPHPP